MVADYVGRLPWPTRLIEVEERRKLPAADRMRREAELVRGARPKGPLVVLDPGGKAVDSAAFAKRIGAYRDRGTAELVFLIGGADGIAADLKAEADWLLSLGAMTWPHRLARVLLAEQLYRAASLLAGHPYHR